MNRLMKLTSFLFTLNHVCNCDHTVQVCRMQRELKRMRLHQLLSMEMLLPSYLVLYRTLSSANIVLFLHQPQDERLSLGWLSSKPFRAGTSALPAKNACTFRLHPTFHPYPYQHFFHSPSSVAFGCDAAALSISYDNPRPGTWGAQSTPRPLGSKPRHRLHWYRDRRAFYPHW
jgi:hypothetical protein